MPNEPEESPHDHDAERDHGKGRAVREIAARRWASPAGAGQATSSRSSGSPRQTTPSRSSSSPAPTPTTSSHTSTLTGPRIPGGSRRADRRSIDRRALPSPEREPAGHDRPDRRARPWCRQRIRVGLRHAIRGTRDGDLRPVRARVRAGPGRRRGPVPHTADGSCASTRGHVERGRLRRGPRRALWLDQPCAAGRCARRVRRRTLAHRIAVFPAAGHAAVKQRVNAISLARSRTFDATPISSGTASAAPRRNT